jgi:hypothetical protein
MAEKDSVQIKKQLSEKLPEYKFSVTRNDFAGGHSVNVRVLSGPFEVFADDNARDRQNGYIEIWRDKYKEDERINDAIKPDIDKMYKIIYDIGQFPSGYHGGHYLHWNFGSYSSPYKVTASKKSTPAPRAEKSSDETNADSELLMTFSQGWSLYKTTITKKDYDGKTITLVVYNLNKTKDLKNIPYDKFLEFKGEMLTNLGMKWGKFQKFEKWTFPPDTDILKVIIDKYYGAGESKKEETPTPQPAPKSNKMSVKEIADRLMTLDSTLWDRLKIESGSQLYSDDDLQKKYIKYWTEFYEGDTSIPTKMKELSMRERNELSDYFEDDNYHALKNLFMLYGYFGIDNKVSAELYYSTSGYGLNPKNFKSEDKKEEEFKVGDVYLDKLSQGKLKITEVGLKEIMVLIEIGNYLDTYNKVYARLMIERGDWVKIIDEEKEEQLPFKEGDKFLLTINSGDTTLTILDIDEKDVKVQYADGSKGIFELDTAKSRVERGVWKKVLDEEKEEITFKTGDKFLVKGRPDKIFELGLIAMGQVMIITPDMGEVAYNLTEVKQRFESGAWTKIIDEEKEGGTEEEIKKAIAALEILAEDGDEDARKGIEALKILLN